MRKKVFAGNWKMNLGPRDAAIYIDEFLRLVTPSAHAEWVLFPPAISIPMIAEKLKKSFVKWGSQNSYFEASGAFTGEISPSMLKEVGCQYGLVGHSERRHLFGETNQMCSRKVRALAEQGIVPVLCVGETQKERDLGHTISVLKEQVNEGLSEWAHDMPLIIAYEPVWAIGTGKVATPAMADEAHIAIRHILAEEESHDVAARTQILYGGSVKPDNCQELAMFPNIDGFLVGGASLLPKTFAQIGQLPL